jgi:hypothetical protein
MFDAAFVLLTVDTVISWTVWNCSLAEATSSRTPLHVSSKTNLLFAFYTQRFIIHEAWYLCNTVLKGYVINLFPNSPQIVQQISAEECRLQQTTRFAYRSAVPIDSSNGVRSTLLINIQNRLAHRVAPCSCFCITFLCLRNNRCSKYVLYASVSLASALGTSDCDSASCGLA